MTKKERLTLQRERDKLDRALGGIKDMGGTPDMIFIVDTNKESIAIDEAKRLRIPIVAVVDSNCNPGPIDYPIPGNDDAARAITLYCDLIARAAVDGIARQQGDMGVDVGAMEEAPVEEVLARSDRPARRKPSRPRQRRGRRRGHFARARCDRGSPARIAADARRRMTPTHEAAMQHSWRRA